MKQIFLFGFACLMLLSGCRKNIDETIIDTISPDPEIISYARGDVFGRIVDESGNGLTGVSIFMDDSTATSDEYGFFYIRNRLMNEDGAYLTANLNGYFQGSRTFIPVEGQVSRVQITLLERTISGSFLPGAGGVIEVNGGGLIEFPEESIVDLSGQTFNGEVLVAAKWLNPDNPDFADQMPGDLRALNLAGERQTLSSFGMFTVELQDSLGTPLAIRENKLATLIMPIPQNLQNLAPESIPLWYFDEEMGVWLEEGKAFLEGNQYVGEVSHFTTWNCDIPGPRIFSEGQVVSESGLPMPNLSIGFYLDGLITSAQGYTGEGGYFVGYIPAEQILTLIVVSSCGNVVYEEDFGPFDMAVNLGQIVIPDNEVATIFGNVVDCNGSPVSEGYVLLEDSNYRAVLINPDGSFSYTYLYCGEQEIGISALNFATFEKGIPELFGFEPLMDVGTLVACGSALNPPYIALTVNNRSYYWINDSVQGILGVIDLAKQIDGNPFGLSGPATQILGEYANQNDPEEMGFELVFAAQDVTSNLSEAYFYLNSTEDENGPYYFNEVFQFSQLDITEYEQFPGGVIRGNFEVVIPVAPEVPNELNVSCHFAVFRE